MVAVNTWDCCVKLTECQCNRKHGAVIPPFSTEIPNMAKHGQIYDPVGGTLRAMATRDTYTSCITIRYINQKYINILYNPVSVNHTPVFSPKVQVPKMEVLNLIRLFWGWVFRYISLPSNQQGKYHLQCSRGTGVWETLTLAIWCTLVNVYTSKLDSFTSKDVYIEEMYIAIDHIVYKLQ